MELQVVPCSWWSQGFGTIGKDIPWRKKWLCQRGGFRVNFVRETVSCVHGGKKWPGKQKGDQPDELDRGYYPG